LLHVTNYKKITKNISGNAAKKWLLHVTNYKKITKNISGNAAKKWLLHVSEETHLNTWRALEPEFCLKRFVRPPSFVSWSRAHLEKNLFFLFEFRDLESSQ
jgi:hypothetical protein